MNSTQRSCHPRTKRHLFFCFVFDLYFNHLGTELFFSYTSDAKILPPISAKKRLRNRSKTHRTRKAMAAPVQPNSVPSTQPDPKIGSVFDFLLDLDKMIIAVKDVERDECSICTEPYADKSPDGEKSPVKLPCGHIFDLDCLLNWLSVHSPGSHRNACSLCRKPLFLRLRPEDIVDVRHLRRFLVVAKKDHQQSPIEAKKDHQRSSKEDDEFGKDLLVLVAMTCLLHFFPKAVTWLMVYSTVMAAARFFGSRLVKRMGW